MMDVLLVKSFRDQRRGILGWGIAVTAVGLMYAAIYPSIESSASQLNEYVKNLPEAVKALVGGEDYASPAGYLRSEFFSTMGPLLFLVYAIGAGARAIAGEEESRTLDLLLSTPLRRPQVLRDKAITIASTVAVLAVLAFASLAVFGPAFDLTVPVADLAAACLMLALLGIAFAGISLAVGSFTGRRSLANAIAGGLAVLAFIVNAFAVSVSWLEPLRPISPLRWYMEPDPLKEGLDPLSMLILVAIAVVSYALAHVSFVRRDLAA
jgi:ABC-2 type transport system permease protein